MSVRSDFIAWKTAVWRILSGALAVLSVAATGLSMENLEQPDAGGTVYFVLSSLRGWGIGQFLFVVCLACIYFHFAKKGAWQKDIAALSFLFSLFMLTGLCYQDAVGVSLILQSGAQFVKACIVVLGYSALFYPALFLLQEKLRQVALAVGKGGENKFSEGKGLNRLKVSGFLFLCWLPYLIVFYPGTTTYDAGTMLEQYFGYAPLTNHHPYLQILFIGLFVQVGHACGSGAAGMFVYVLLQVFAFIVVLTYMADVLWRAGAGRRVIGILLMIYGFCPIFPIYAIAVGKNINFSIVALLLTLFLFEAAVWEEAFAHSKVKMALLPVLLILLCLFRNEGIAYVIGCLPCFLAVMKGHRKMIFSIFISVFTFIILWFRWFLPFAGVENGSVAEGLSLPFVQTARCVYYDGKNMPEEERAAIDAVLQFDTLASRYVPESSDNVKRYYNNDATREELLAYCKVYLKQFTVYPLVYVDAALNKCYGYFCPDDKGRGKLYYVNYASVPTLNDDGFDLKSVFPKTVDEIGRILSVMRDIPFVGYMTSIGFYFWCAFLSAFFIWKCQKRLLWMFMPAAVTLFVCVISPINAYFRYGLPVVFSLPFFAGAVICAMAPKELS